MRSSGERSKAAEPLSLLVDGEDIVEAVLVSAGETYCYPCNLGKEDETLISFLEDIFASGLIPPGSGYVIIGRGEDKLVAVPFSYDKFLVVIAREPIDGEKLARYLSGLPDRLRAILKERSEEEEPHED